MIPTWNYGKYWTYCLSCRHQLIMELAVSSFSWLWQATRAELEFNSENCLWHTSGLSHPFPMCQWEGRRMKEWLSEGFRSSEVHVCCFPSQPGYPWAADTCPHTMSLKTWQLHVLFGFGSLSITCILARQSLWNRTKTSLTFVLIPLYFW